MGQANLYDEMRSKLAVLADTWGRRYGTSASVPIHPKVGDGGQFLYLRKGSTWQFDVGTAQVKVALATSSVALRLAAVAAMPALREQLEADLAERGAEMAEACRQLDRLIAADTHPEVLPSLRE